MPQPSKSVIDPRARVILDRALAADNGIEIEFPTFQIAWRFMTNCWTARTRARKKSLELFEQDHPMYGRSAYDDLVIRVEGPYSAIASTVPKKDRESHPLKDRPHKLIILKDEIAASQLNIKEL